MYVHACVCEACVHVCIYVSVSAIVHSRGTRGVSTVRVAARSSTPLPLVTRMGRSTARVSSHENMHFMLLRSSFPFQAATGSSLAQRVLGSARELVP